MISYPWKGVNEMEVNLYSDVSYPYHKQKSSDVARNEFMNPIEAKISEESSYAEKAKIIDETMMDVKEMKTFLYMLIGSEIKVESEDTALGRGVDTAA